MPRPPPERTEAPLDETSGPPGDANRSGKSPIHESDRNLVREAKRDRKNAVEQFIERMRCVPRMLAAMNSRSGRPLDDQELGDLVQETLAAIWKKLDEFAGHASLETWAYRFCAHEWANGVRRKARRPTLASECEEGALLRRSSHPEKGPGLADALDSGLERLRESEAAVIRCRHFEDLTFEEIARRLALSVNTVKTRYYRGLEKLRDHLAAFGDGEREARP